MPINDTDATVTINADGSRTTWPFTFRVWDTSHVKVTVSDADGVDNVLSSGFSVSLTDGGEIGGEVTYPLAGDPLAAGYRVTVERNMPIEQQADFDNNTAFLAEVVELALDKQAALSQQLRVEIARCLKVGATVSDTDPSDLLHAINVAAASTASDAATAEAAATSATAAEASMFHAYKEFTGDGVETDFTLDYEADPVGKNVFVVEGGVPQAKGNYSIEADGVGDYKILRFAVAPGNGVEIMTWLTDPASNPDIDTLVAQALAVLNALTTSDLGTTVEPADPDILKADTADILQAVYGDEAQTHTGTDLSTLTISSNHILWTLTASSQFSDDFTLPVGWTGTLVFHVYLSGQTLALAASYKMAADLPEIDPLAGEVRIVVEVFNGRKSIISLQNVEA